MKTWRLESAFVAGVLAMVSILHGNHWQEWLASLAVWLSFGHACIADRMAERQAQQSRPSVECYRKLVWYLVAKEVAWVALFIALQSYASLAGCAIFLTYPIWRRIYRRHRPLGRKP
jgi:hypothetical protein